MAYEPREPQPLVDGYLYQYRIGNSIAVMTEDGDDLFTVSVDADRTFASILTAALHAYYRGFGEGKAAGRAMLGGELRKLIGAQEAGFGE